MPSSSSHQARAKLVPPFASAFLGLLLISCGFLVGSSHAETTNYSGATLVPGTTISSTAASTSTSFNITNPGTYYLAQDINATNTGSAAINITASNVTLDLNGHTIAFTGSGQPNGLVYGVYGSNVSNITVRNGTIAGFLKGVYFAATVYDLTSPSYGHLLENLNLLKDTYVGADLRGAGCRIYHCRAVLCGGSSTNATSYGFYFWGANHSLEDSDVVGKSGANSLTGACVMYSNGGSGTNYLGSFIVNNRFSSITTGIYAGSTGSVKYSNNLTANVGTAYSGSNITDAGGNN